MTMATTTTTHLIHQLESPVGLSLPRRLLLGHTSTATPDLSAVVGLSQPRRLLLQASPTEAPSTDPSAAVGTDVFLILAALLCALICVLGLALAARCVWLRRAVMTVLDPATASARASNKGLKKKAISALPKLAFSLAHGATLPYSDCPICLADFAEGDEVRVLPRCAHAFHAPCIDKWLKSHSSCPSCRQNLADATDSKQALPEANAPVELTVAQSCHAVRCQLCGLAGSSTAGVDGREQGAKH